MKIAIIEDDKSYREALVAGLSNFPDCNVIHQLPNALDVKMFFLKDTPDLALVDINMPGISGMECVAIISKNFPSVKCIMLTVNEDLDLVMECLKQGARGYLLKNKDSLLRIVESMRTLHLDKLNEDFPINSRLANKILQHFSTQQVSREEKMDNYHLTKREKEILNLLYHGKTYQQIADGLNISVSTVATHIKVIYRKLDINNRSSIRELLD
jgi:DNA-binding NarL/FixJ family response regulator